MQTYNELSDPGLQELVKGEWKNKMILHHTGNMYGIGCNAFNQELIRKLSTYKGKTDTKGYIILIPDPSWLARYGLSLPPELSKLVQQYWPGNLTIVLPDDENRFSHIAYNGSVGVRVPTNGFLRRFLNLVDEPIVSTSINATGDIPLERYKDIIRMKGDWFDFGVLSNDVEEIAPSPSTIIGFKGKELLFYREGNISFADIRLSMELPLIRFICTGNICRSPIAEYLTQFKIQSEGLKFRVASAGFLDAGNRISALSYDLLSEIGIDASSHRSTKITKKLIEQSWLILTMEESHKAQILKLDPNAVAKTFTLSEICGSEYCHPNCDIEDPYGLERTFYQKAFGMIEERINCLLEKLKREEL
ncbi:MAG: Sua5/YciO/YrdC/YwlC family protein [Candidatus Cloacimonetes bacterium]|nr:Sua5/YciO/YrdC/YwlC family protein [Candidatus Cloacimonadota bacterium]